MIQNYEIREQDHHGLQGLYSAFHSANDLNAAKVLEFQQSAYGFAASGQLRDDQRLDRNDALFLG